MAIITPINSPGKQNHAGIAGTIDYATQDKKTVWEREKLVGTLNCTVSTAAKEFIHTKQMFGKDSGVMYFHYTVAFPPGENITPKQCHEYAMEYARRRWNDYEVVVATHSDADHIHSHFVINSVSFVDGKKFHSDQAMIQSLQKQNDEMCLQFGYSVCQKKPKNERVRAMKQSEYHSALKGESWKMEMRIAIEDAMRYAVSKKHFFELMKSEGYGVRWEKDRKSITYTHPNGKKCRDFRLGENKYLKEAMENEFRIRASVIYGTAESTDQSERGNGVRNADDGNTDGQKLGRADQFGDASLRAGGTEQRNAPPACHGTADERSARTADTESADRSERNGIEDSGSSEAGGGTAERTDNTAPGSDEGIDLRDIVTGWERERLLLLSVLRDDGRHEKVAAKGHVDKSHSHGAGYSRGSAALNLIGSLMNVVENTPPKQNPDGDEDDIDKELRRQEQAVKDGINLVM